MRLSLQWLLLWLWAPDAGSVAVAQGLSFSMAGGIFPDQGLSLHLLQWQEGSLQLSTRGDL